MKHKVFSKLFLCAISILIVLMISCTKFLDKQPDHSVAVPYSLSDLQALLDHSARMNLQTSPGMGEASADAYFLTEDVYDSYDANWQKLYTWKLREYNFGNDWNAGYFPVYTANYCLDRLEKIPVTSLNSTEWNNVFGSALFFRSFNFLNLLWNFSNAYDEATAYNDPGIVLKLSSDFNIKSKRANVAECYQRVIRDARDAISYLPELPLNVMRPSRASAYALLARAFLSMRSYDSAFKYSSLSLGIKSDLMNYNTDVDLSSNVPFRRFNNEILFYTEMATYYPINLPFWAKVDTTLFGRYSDDDLRKSVYFKPSGEYYEPKGNYTANEYQFFSGLATDEIYLVKAESLARLNRLAEAVSTLNELLVTRYRTGTFAPLSFTSTNEALERILEEREKELFFRGVRWMDIKRLNIDSARITLTRIIDGDKFTLAPGDPYYALPLPEDVIQQAGIEQNKF